MSLSASNLGYMMSHDDNRAAKMATYQALLQAEANRDRALYYNNFNTASAQTVVDELKKNLAKLNEKKIDVNNSQYRKMTHGGYIDCMDKYIYRGGSMDEDKELDEVTQDEEDDEEDKVDTFFNKYKHFDSSLSMRGNYKNATDIHNEAAREIRRQLDAQIMKDKHIDDIEYKHRKELSNKLLNPYKYNLISGKPIDYTDPNAKFKKIVDEQYKADLKKPGPYTGRINDPSLNWPAKKYLKQ